MAGLKIKEILGVHAYALFLYFIKKIELCNYHFQNAGMLMQILEI